MGAYGLDTSSHHPLPLLVLLLVPLPNLPICAPLSEACWVHLYGSHTQKKKKRVRKIYKCGTSLFLSRYSFHSYDPSKKSKPNTYLVSIATIQRNAVNGVVVDRGDYFLLLNMVSIHLLVKMPCPPKPMLPMPATLSLVLSRSG